MAAPAVAKQLLDTHEAATYTGIPEGTLRNMRCRGDGPSYVKSGRRVRYRVADLDAWITAHTVTTH